MPKLSHAWGTGKPATAAKSTSPGHASSTVPTPTEPFAVTIQERDPPGHGVTVALAGTIPKPEGGGGGYEEVQMPKRGAVSVWPGRGLMRMTFDVRFDRKDAGTPVGPDYAALLEMWRPAKDTTPPPIVKVASTGDVIPYSSLDWTIETLEWDDAEAEEKGNRTEQTLTITLREFNPDERLETAKQHKAGHKTTVEVKNPKKETLGTIAKRYHVEGGAKALAKAQHPPIKDPRHLTKGQKIVVPLP